MSLDLKFLLNLFLIIDDFQMKIEKEAGSVPNDQKLQYLIDN